MELLDQVAISQPAKRVHAYPQRNRGMPAVMIAMAISNDPEVLIADEPTTALDVTVQAQIMDLLGNLRREHHLALVLITHDLGVVAGEADRVAVMYAGRVVERGSVAALFADPGHPYTRGLLECLPRLDARHEVRAAIPGVPASPQSLPPGCPFAFADSPSQCSHAEPVGPWRHHHRMLGVRMTDTPILSVRNLVKEFKIRDRGRASVVHAVSGVSFDVQQGETLALVGESGCGKSTTGRCVLRLVEPTSGSVQFRGDDLLGLGRDALRRMRRHMQIVFQDPQASLHPRLTVRRLLAEPLQVHGEPADVVSARVEELLAWCNCTTSRSLPQFSGGRRQRIGITRSPSHRRCWCWTSPCRPRRQHQAEIMGSHRPTWRLGLYTSSRADLAVVRQHRSSRRDGTERSSRSARPIRSDSPQHPYANALRRPVPDHRSGTASESCCGAATRHQYHRFAGSELAAGARSNDVSMRTLLVTRGGPALASPAFQPRLHRSTEYRQVVERAVCWPSTSACRRQVAVIRPPWHSRRRASR